MKSVFVGLVLAAAALSANAGDARSTQALHQPHSDGVCPDGQVVEYFYNPVTHSMGWKCVSLG